METETPPPGTEALFGVAFSQAKQFARLLSAEGELRGVIGPREAPRLWSRHICNSTAVEPFIRRQSVVADLGAGAGFPGIVLAIQRPDLEVVLIEPMERRCAWLADVCDEVGLDNVKIYQARAHELHGEMQFDYLTSRAVAALPKLVNWGAPLVRPGGTMVALKGERAQAELDASKRELAKFQISKAKVNEVPRPGSEIPAHVITLELPRLRFRNRRTTKSQARKTRKA